MSFVHFNWAETKNVEGEGRNTEDVSDDGDEWNSDKRKWKSSLLKKKWQ